MEKLRDIIRLIRPGQWVKNLFVFLPLFFGGGLLMWRLELLSLVTFISFSLASSAVYVVNDIHDRRTDAAHPVKRHRPLAAGRVSLPTAWATAALLAAASLALAFTLCPLPTALIIAAYLLLNLLYSFLLKRIAIADVITIALGFVLRVYAGGTACGVPVSPWLTVMVFMLTLFIAFGKRRDDLTGAAPSHCTRSEARSAALAPSHCARSEARSAAPAPSHCARSEARRQNRPVGYTINFIDQTMTMLAGILTVAYIIYTLSPEVTARFDSDYVFITALFVVAGILRYMQAAMVLGITGDPSRLALRDPALICCIAGWLASFIIIIYL